MSAHGVKQAYDRLPRPLQTLALNLFGIRNRRRMAAWRRYLKEIEPTERMPREDLIQLVDGHLREILVHAVRTVPRYRAYSHLLGHLQAPSADVFSLLLEFPAIARDEVRSDPKAFMSNRPGTRRLVRTLTSGTTGTPFATWMDTGTFMRTDALWWRRSAWSGHREGDWIARIVGDPIVPLADASPKEPWRMSWTDRRIYLSSFHLRRDTAHAYLDLIDRVRPAFVQGYPSSLEILARFALERGKPLQWTPRAVWYASEPMYAHQRDVVTRAFGAPLVGLYGSAERIVSAAECEKGCYHLAALDGFVEGQFGRLDSREPALVTTLMNRVMPLIRFELGDNIQPAPDLSCECGRTLPVIEPVITKHEDWVETPSGRHVSSSVLTWAFKDLEGVRRSQIVQLDGSAIEVHIDADEQAFAAASEVLRARLGEMLFGEMELRFVLDRSIRVTESGKTRFVVRRMAVPAGQGRPIDGT